MSLMRIIHIKITLEHIFKVKEFCSSTSVFIHSEQKILMRELTHARLFCWKLAKVDWRRVISKVKC